MGGARRKQQRRRDLWYDENFQTKPSETKKERCEKLYHTARPRRAPEFESAPSAGLGLEHDRQRKMPDRPLPESNSNLAPNPHSDGKNHVEIVVRQISGDSTLTLDPNLSEIPTGCRLFKLFVLINVLNMLYYICSPARNTRHSTVRLKPTTKTALARKSQKDLATKSPIGVAIFLRSMTVRKIKFKSHMTCSHSRQAPNALNALPHGETCT